MGSMAWISKGGGGGHLRVSSLCVGCCVCVCVFESSDPVAVSSVLEFFLEFLSQSLNLRHNQLIVSDLRHFFLTMAERVGFEPTVAVTLRLISNQVP